jgi:membrane associated rhomboid family serine protease
VFGLNYLKIVKNTMDGLSINSMLCIITGIVSILLFANQGLKEKFLHIPYNEYHNNEKYRLLTSGFIHGDYMHLLFNMIALFSFGSNVESWFSQAEMFGSNGTIVYIMFYLVAIVAANLPTYAEHKNNPNYRSLGASGAIAAVIFASIINSPMSMILMPFPMPGFLFGILYLWYENSLSKKNIDNIAHDAHFYGALFGVLFIAVFKTKALGACYEEIFFSVKEFFLK